MLVAKQVSRIFIALSLVVVFVSPTTASAQGGLIIESRSHELNERERGLLDQVVGELVTKGFVATIGTAEQEATKTVKLSDVTALLKEGLESYYEVEFDKAQKPLSKALELLELQPANPTEIEELRERRLQALTALGVMHQRKKREGKARQVFEVLVREFPDIDSGNANKLRKQNAAGFGGDVAAYRELVRARLTENAKLSTLKLTASGEIYVDSRHVGSETATVQLLPGSYRVFAKNDRGIGGFQKIHLAEGSTTTVALDLELELATASASVPTIVFDTPAEQQEKERTLANRLTRVAKQRRAVLLSVRPSGDKWLVGTLIGQGGELLRGASIGPFPTEADIETFTESLSGKTPATAELSSSAESSEGRRILTWGLLGCGLGGVAGGASILTVGPDDSSFRAQGIGLMAVGGACLLGFSGMLIWGRPDQTPEPGDTTVGISITPNSVGLSTRF